MAEESYNQKNQNFNSNENNNSDKLEPIYQIQKKLFKLRIEKGLTQKELAEMIGTKQSVISRLEQGNCNPNLETLKRIAKAFDKKLIINFV